MARILVLGKTGMLGSMAYKYLTRSSKHTVVATVRKEKYTEKISTIKQFNVENFFKKQDDFSYLLDFDYIINCIGIIKPHCKDTDPIGVQNAIIVNALFPHKLSDYCKDSSVKIIQIATDCVFSGKKGNYTENSPHDALDVYGKTKSLGEVLNKNLLNVRCSIIGPELKTRFSLLEWFLSQNDNAQIKGFTNHIWNGVTTLQFARLCLRIIENDRFAQFVKDTNLYHFVPNNAVTKYELLKLFQEIFKKNVTVTPAKSEEKINRKLATNYPAFTNLYGHGTIRDALLELNNFIKISHT